MLLGKMARQKLEGRFVLTRSPSATHWLSLQAGLRAYENKDKSPSRLRSDWPCLKWPGFI